VDRDNTRPTVSNTAAGSIWMETASQSMIMYVLSSVLKRVIVCDPFFLPSQIKHF